jgi:hypothetical protein
VESRPPDSASAKPLMPHLPRYSRSAIASASSSSKWGRSCSVSARGIRPRSAKCRSDGSGARTSLPASQYGGTAGGGLWVA